MTKPLLVICIFLLITACEKDKTLATFLDCETDNVFTHDKVLKDAQNFFELEIGNHWKRELFVDHNQSRIYAADTTRNFYSSFIIDITRFQGKIQINKEFQQKITQSIQSTQQSYLIKDDFFDFEKQSGYGVFYFEKKGEQPTYFLEFYIAYQNHYYLLKSTLLGSENFEANLCESMQVLNSFHPFP